MAEKMDVNRIIRGNFGHLWMDDELLPNVKEFVLDFNLKYETVEISGDLAEHQRYMGYAGEGTMTLHKIDSKFFAKYAKGIQTGILPAIKLVGKVEDPTAFGAERIAVSGVTFDKITALKFANGSLGEEEIPFKFTGFEALDLIA